MGKVSVSFTLDEAERIILDYREAEEHILALTVNGREVKYRYFNEHIVIPQSAMQRGENRIDIAFRAGDQSLNRNEEYMYTLLVPDRARTLFPCFDQPDMKASFTLHIELPKEWVAVANSPIVEQHTQDERTYIEFAPTEPLSTYLFSFVAGKLSSTTYDDGRHRFTAYYRENDPKRLAQLDTIFSEVATSLEWIEEYTSIPYPFSKYDFVILPGFQYGGMEHTGATLYNDRHMFLGENPTLDERLRRTQLIAHETIHMWFGDYVTMCWFDDVWTKEVFANYFAARIVEPLYDNVSHELNSLKTYTRAAMGEDRTAGSTSIRQNLDNLRDAGLIYGQIIYNKAPIVMNKLVEMMGEESFRLGIQEYLRTYAYGNATWPELITILDRYTDEDLATFSDVWVHQKGMPEIILTRHDDKLHIMQHDRHGRGICWPQSFNCRAILDDGTHHDIAVTLREAEHRYTLPEGTIAVIPNIDGRGYGLFRTDNDSLAWIMKNIESIDGQIESLATLMTLYECYKHDIVAPEAWLELLLRILPLQQDELLCTTIATYIGEVLIDAPTSEGELRALHLAEEHALRPLRRKLLSELCHAATSMEVVDRLYTIWHEAQHPDLNETDYIDFALELALRKPELQQEIIAQQLTRLTNEDRRKQFEYVSRATAPDIASRDAMFEWLLEPENRRTEPWAATALGLLNHHTRQQEAIKYIYVGLAEMQEVQRTGDIFFPRNWAGALLGGHHSSEARAEVERFFKDNPDYPTLLKNKILQAVHCE